MWLEIERRSGIDRRTCAKPYTREGVPWEAAPYVIAEGVCPGCGAECFRVRGCGIVNADEPPGAGQAYKAGGRCVDCGEAVGWLYTEIETLFGLEEDRAVLHGRCRVY